MHVREERGESSKRSEVHRRFDISRSAVYRHLAAERRQKYQGDGPARADVLGHR